MKHPYLDSFDIGKEAYNLFSDRFILKNQGNGHTKIHFNFTNSDHSQLVASIDYLEQYTYCGINKDALLSIEPSIGSLQRNTYIFIDPIAALVSATINQLYGIQNIGIVVLPEEFNDKHIKHLKERFPEAFLYEHFVDHRNQFKKTPAGVQKALILESICRGHFNRFDIELIENQILFLNDRKSGREVIHQLSENRKPSLARYFFNDNYTNTPKQIPKRNRCRTHGVFNKTAQTEKYYVL